MRWYTRRSRLQRNTAHVSLFQTRGHYLEELPIFSSEQLSVSVNLNCINWLITPGFISMVMQLASIIHLCPSSSMHAPVRPVIHILLFIVVYTCFTHRSLAYLRNTVFQRVRESFRHILISSYDS